MATSSNRPPAKKAPVKKAVTKKTLATAANANTAAVKANTSATTGNTAAVADAADRLDTKTVVEMIQQFTEQAEGISARAEEFQETWVATVAAENITFKRRNAVLVRNNVIMKRVMVWILIPMLLVMTVAVGTLSYRSFFVTGPIIETLDDQKVGIDKLVEFVEGIQQASACDPNNPPPEGCPPPGQTADYIADLVCADPDAANNPSCAAHR